jgi:hypothetical protein
MSTVSDPQSLSYALRFPVAVAASLRSADGNGKSFGDWSRAEAIERIKSGVERSCPSETRNVLPAAFGDCTVVEIKSTRLSSDTKLRLFWMEPSGSGIPRLTMPINDAKFARTPGP